MRFLSSLLVAVLAVAPITAAASLERRITAEQARKNTKTSNDPKYFLEPGGDNELGHYDNRYYKGKVSYDEHRAVLRQLIRSYLVTFKELGVETWLAHGTLLGWWWNGRIMPWDPDLDVQMSISTLQYLAKNFNRTTHEYHFKDESGKDVKKEYLLDVNPHHSDINRGNGMNVIDARWIDVSNGMFIDITGLAERSPSTQPGVWSCKNFHRYRTSDLYPMRETEFEGVPVTIPYAFERILTDEYGAKSLVTTVFEG